MGVIRSVVVDDFDFKGIPIFELEAKPPLIVDTKLLPSKSAAVDVQPNDSLTVIV